MIWQIIVCLETDRIKKNEYSLFGLESTKLSSMQVRRITAE